MLFLQIWISYCFNWLHCLIIWYLLKWFLITEGEIVILNKPTLTHDIGWCLHTTEKMPAINLHHNHDMNVYMNVFLFGSSFIINRAVGNEGVKIGIVHLVVLKIPRKNNTFNPLVHTHICAYQGIRNVSFSKNFAYVVNGSSHRILQIFLKQQQRCI